MIRNHDSALRVLRNKMCKSTFVDTQPQQDRLSDYAKPGKDKSRKNELFKEARRENAEQAEADERNMVYHMTLNGLLQQGGEGIAAVKKQLRNLLDSKCWVPREPMSSPEAKARDHHGVYANGKHVGGSFHESFNGQEFRDSMDLC